MTAPRRDRVLVPVTILNGVALSQEVNLGGMQLVGFLAPAAWTAAGLSIQVLTREAAGPPKVPTYGALKDGAGAEVTAAAAVADTMQLFPSAIPLWGLGRCRVVSGTTAVPVNQGAQRDFFLICLT